MNMMSFHDYLISMEQFNSFGCFLEIIMGCFFNLLRSAANMSEHDIQGFITTVSIYA